MIKIFFFLSSSGMRDCWKLCCFVRRLFSGNLSKLEVIWFRDVIFFYFLLTHYDCIVCHCF